MQFLMVVTFTIAPPLPPELFSVNVQFVTVSEFAIAPPLPPYPLSIV